MTTYYEQTKRPEPVPSDRQTINNALSAKAAELIGELVSIARVGAGLPPGGLVEAAALAGAPVKVVDLTPKPPELSPAARAARNRIILVVNRYVNIVRSAESYEAKAEAQDNWLKVLDREL